MNRIIAHPAGMTAADLLRETKIPKTTLYRLLHSLTEGGFLRFDEIGNTYSVGPLFTMTYVAMDERSNYLRTVSIKHMTRLCEEVQETVKLSVLSGWHTYTIASVESKRPVRIKIDIGSIFPLHAGATGKIFLSNLSSNALRKYYETNAKKYTDVTITRLREMELELKDVKKNGYATDAGEYLSEIYAIAVPIKNTDNQTIAALSIPYPPSHAGTINVQKTAELLMRTAGEIVTSYLEKAATKNDAHLINDLAVSYNEFSKL